jgi:hypothetical protein
MKTSLSAVLLLVAPAIAAAASVETVPTDVETAPPATEASVTAFWRAELPIGMGHAAVVRRLKARGVWYRDDNGLILVMLAAGPDLGLPRYTDLRMRGHFDESGVLIRLDIRREIPTP